MTKNTATPSPLPTILVIFGATGDLMAKKLVPALFSLWKEKKLPPLFQIIGFSRRELATSAFRQYLSSILAHDPIFKAATTADREAFTRLFTYQQGNFDDVAAYTTMARDLGHIDHEWKACANKLFYLAVPPQYLKTIVSHLHSSRLTEACSEDQGWTRVLVEKPFGHDLQTAEHLDALLGKLFREEQIYRIDHYLAKEMLQNILVFRFANNLFEKIWNNKFIEQIDIRFWEELGVEDRGAFYDSVGALRDVGQNHVLQMLALVTMDRPADFSAAAIRAERADILRAVRPMTRTDIKRRTARAQYAGYRDIAGVAPHSAAETYFKVQTYIDTPRWRRVPLVMEGGKRLGQTKKEIVITFRHPSPCLCPKGQPHHKNQIIFSLDPVEGITIKFWSKQPGIDLATEERDINFMLREHDTESQYVDQYKKLLLDAVRGDQTLFNDTAEVEATWRFVDPIIRGWGKNAVPLATYMPGITDTSEIGQLDPTTSGLPHTIGLIGLGKMGGGLARRLNDVDWNVVAYNRTPAVTEKIAQGNIRGAYSLPDLVAALPSPRVIWLMLPAGKVVDELLFGSKGLVRLLRRGDIIIDGGNSYYLDTIVRAKKLKKYGIKMMDVGVSGGPAGARHRPCLMIGGDKTTFIYLKPLIKALAAFNSYQFFPGTGAGHFVKMVHNGIEYGMMQALAEGVAVLKKSPYKLDLKKVADIYNNGSVIESRLVAWLRSGLDQYGTELRGVSASVAHTGEGAWTIQTAKKLGITTPIIEGSLRFRKQSAAKPSYTGQVLSMLRNQFGGHSIEDDK